MDYREANELIGLLLSYFVTCLFDGEFRLAYRELVIFESKKRTTYWCCGIGLN